MTKTSVCFIAPNMTFGGAERQMYLLVRHLDRARFTPTLVALNLQGEFYDQAVREGVDCRFLAVKGKFPIGGLFALVKVLRDVRADVVVTRGYSATVLGRVAARLAGVRVTVVCEHASAWIGRPTTGRGTVEALLRAVTSAWVQVSEAQREFLTQRRHIPPSRLHTIPNGVEDSSVGAPSRSLARSQLGLSDDAFVIGAIAVLRPEKDHATLLRAFGLLHDRDADARLVIVGDGPEREKIERFAAELGLGACVTLLGARYDVGNVLPAFDVVCLSSKTEAAPLSLLEAMSASVPIVASRVGGIPHMVTDGVNGLLTDPGDPSAFAAALDRVRTDGGLRSDLGQGGRARYCREFTAETMTRSYERLFDSLLGGEAR